MSSRNKWQNELGAAGRGGKTGLILTQVPSHQIGIVEILHAQSDDVDEFLYDLHELHRPRIDLDRIKKMRRHTEEMRGAVSISQIQEWLLSLDGWKNAERKIKARKREDWEAVHKCILEIRPGKSAE